MDVDFWEEIVCQFEQLHLLILRGGGHRVGGDYKALQLLREIQQLLVALNSVYPCMSHDGHMMVT